MSDEEDDFNPLSHKKLLQNINNLGKTQHIRKATRNEPQAVIDEFHLVKPKKSETVAPSKENKVVVSDIVNILKSSDKHVQAGKQLRNVVSSKKVLPKPLEKPAAERIKRSIGYENVKKKLGRWDAVVAKNRTAETQVFPLTSETIYINTAAQGKPLERSLKSDLAKQMEEAEERLRQLKRQRAGDLTDEKEQERIEQLLLKKKITQEEIKAYRRELAYLRMKESQKSAKARLQNKIKSKKYHKLMKKQKMMAQIKEFEQLQKTNPEAALEKLNAIEKTRALERASLRHKNTGTWAKNLQVRAKYDHDVRKDLAEQLQISRELTQQKFQVGSDDEENENKNNLSSDEEKGEVDPFNPWVKVTKNGHKEDDKEENANWRKYWSERNDDEKRLEEYRKELQKLVNGKNEMSSENDSDTRDTKVETSKDFSTTSKENQQKIGNTKENGKSKGSLKKTSKTVAMKPEKPNKKLLTKRKLSNGWIEEPLEEVPSKNESNKSKEETEIRDVPLKKEKLKKKAKNAEDQTPKNIDDIFDELEDKEREKLERKLSKVLKQGKKLEKQQKKLADKKKLSKLKVKEKNELKNLEDLSFKNKNVRPDIDEELTHENNETDTKKSNTSDPAKALEGAKPEEANNKKHEEDTKPDFIDPNKFASIKLQKNVTNLREINDGVVDEGMEFDENDAADVERQMTISQAFEDDDIVADFSAEKKKESELKNAELDLFMPGWGSWAGAGIVQEPKHQKRIVFTADEQRKDEKKEQVFINEEANKHLRKHLVSDLPFPFTSLKDYEASIRAPIGRSFVPETAFKMLTRPSIITKKGQIIEPMDDSEIVKAPRRLRNVVDRRIERMNKIKEETKTTANVKIKENGNKEL